MRAPDDLSFAHAVLGTALYIGFGLGVDGPHREGAARRNWREQRSGRNPLSRLGNYLSQLFRLAAKDVKSPSRRSARGQARYWELAETTVD